MNEATKKWGLRSEFPQEPPHRKWSEHDQSWRRWPVGVRTEPASAAEQPAQLGQSPSEEHFVHSPSLA